MGRTGLRHALRGAAVILGVVALAGCHDVTEPQRSIEPGTPRFGAQPAKGVWTVTTLDDASTASCTTSSCSLRSAVAQAQSGDKIVFKGNVSGTVSLVAGQMEVTAKSISIDGGGRITIDGAAKGRAFWVGTGGTLDISGVTITGGDATFNTTCDSFTWYLCSGGAIFVASGGHLSMSNSTLDSNIGLWGGAIAVIGGTSGAGTISMTASTLSGNTATTGGGAVWGVGAAMTVTRTTLSGNQAGLAGAIGNNGGALTLRSSTITGNVGGTSTGGLWSSVIGAAQFTTVMNTIIAGNTRPGTDGDRPECLSANGTIQSFRHNLSTPLGGCQDFFVADGDMLVSSNQLAANVFDPILRDNGGLTKTHALVERGLAIDAGYCPGELLDQRNRPRPYDDTRMPNAVDGCDIGAFEWQPPGKTSK